MNVQGWFQAIVVMAVSFVGAADAQLWTPITNSPPVSVGAMLLLTDGRVLVHSEQTNSQNWYTLTPDLTGSYVNGTWTQVASLPSGYAPLYFASAVLIDGKVIVEGGEYNNLAAAWTSMGALYDPLANVWTPVAPPSGWSSIGDSPSIVLDNGTYMLTDCCNTPPHAALTNNDGTTWTSTGAGKFDVYDEEGEVKMPGGSVLTVDAYVFNYQSNGMNSEIYSTVGTWSGAGSTMVQLWDSCGSYVEGPGVLMPKTSTVFWSGANGCGGAGHTASFAVPSGPWTANLDFPTVGGISNLDVADGPAVLESNGKIMVMTSPGVFNPGAIFFQWDGAMFTQLPGPPNAPSDSSFYGHFLNLPTGQIMFTDFSNDVEFYTPGPGFPPSGAPTVLLTHVVFSRGQTYTLFGTQFNGQSEANEYGNNYQAASNYPLVRITNLATGHVFYCRTHDHSTMAVGYAGPTYTHVDIPAGIETGASTLEVIANGIASTPARIAIR